MRKVGCYLLTWHLTVIIAYEYIINQVAKRPYLRNKLNPLNQWLR
jgi:hypothetical protein